MRALVLAVFTFYMLKNLNFLSIDVKQIDSGVMANMKQSKPAWINSMEFRATQSAGLGIFERIYIIVAMPGARKFEFSCLREDPRRKK